MSGKTKSHMIRALVQSEAEEFHTTEEEQCDRKEALEMLCRDEIRLMYHERGLYRKEAHATNLT